MSYSKGSKGKFTKQSTDIGTPVLARPSIVSAGQAWMGAADVDNNNPETFYFHLFGGAPSAVTLYIYGDLFNQNFYTEIGEHNHGPGTLATGNVSSGTTAHTHTGSVTIGSHSHTGSTSSTGDHVHALRIQTNPFQASDTAVDTLNWSIGDTGYDTFINGNPSETWINNAGTHSHTFTTSTFNYGSQGFTTASTSLTTHGHTVTTGVSGNLGLPPGVGTIHTSGTAKQYFNALKIEIDGVDRTAPLLAQAGLAAFGDGTAGHIIVVSGVELDISAYVTTPGQHKVKFSLTTLSPNNGGKVRYNLYVS